MGKRNPNGYGCVTKLKGNRSRPYMVKVTIYDLDGNAKQVPIDYAKTEEQANIILANYNNNPWDIDRNRVTLIELYNRWAKIRLPRLGKSQQGAMKSSIKHCSRYYGMKYRSIKSYHMQECIDNCGRSYSTQGQIKTLWGHLDRFAYECDIIDKMYSTIITAPPAPETNRVPFTHEEVDRLWEKKDEPWVDSVLIYLYTGFRLIELLGMKKDQVDLEEWTFTGGVKTKNGKGRVVPIHDRIKPFIQLRMSGDTPYFFESGRKKLSVSNYYTKWDKVRT